MSSAGIPAGGAGGGATATPQQYFCYQCQRHVTIRPPPSPTDELECPNCHGGFLEESDTVPPSNPANMTPNPFVVHNVPASAASGGLPLVFSSSSAAPDSVAFSTSSGDGGGELHDISAHFGPRSPDEFNPFAFLSDYINYLQASGASVELVFESSGGGEVSFRLPTNIADYYTGHGLEDLIQQLAENDPNRYGTPPASKSVVEGLPDIKITEEMLASDSSQCAVCKDSFELNEEAKQMPCKHIYHKDCILPWLELHNSCPVCRYELPTDDPDYENRKTGQMNDNTNGNSNRSNLDLGAAGGSQERRNGGNSHNSSTQTQWTEERTIMITLPWRFRVSGSPAETSSSGEGEASSDRGNNSSNSTNSGTSSASSGTRWLAREEDLD